MVMLRGSGEEKLRQAIAAGLVSEEVQEEIESVIAAKQRAERDAQYKDWQIKELEKSNANYRDIYFKALRAKQTEDTRHARNTNVRSAVVIVGAITGITFITTLLSKLILG